MSNNKTAVLLFTRTEAQESEQKNWGHHIGKQGQRNIAKKLIRHSLLIAKKSTLPFFTSFGSEQIGSSFGERLANAIENVFSKGFNKVIAIGNDTPNLTSNLLLEANHLLLQNKIVIGPSKDGGIYLLGIQKEAYNRAAFVKMQWETGSLLLDWKNVIQKSNQSISWLPELLDIDDEKSFFLFLNGKRNISLRNTIKKIVSGFQNSFLKINHIKQCSYILKFSQLRAPPTPF